MGPATSRGACSALQFEMRDLFPGWSKTPVVVFLGRIQPGAHTGRRNPGRAIIRVLCLWPIPEEVSVFPHRLTFHAKTPPAKRHVTALLGKPGKALRKATSLIQDKSMGKCETAATVQGKADHCVHALACDEDLPPQTPQMYLTSSASTQR